MAAAWAVMHRLGLEGYEQLTRTAIDTARKIQAGVRLIDGITIVGEPQAQILAIRVDDGWDARLDIFAVSEALGRRGWYSTGRTIPTPYTQPSATVMRRSPTNSLPISPTPSRRPSAPPPTTATPPTPRSTSGPQDHPLGCRHRQRCRHATITLSRPDRELLDGAHAHELRHLLQAAEDHPDVRA